MSGYLEVKYPFKSNIGLNPFKSWKRQWCILRPSPTSAGGGSLAVYCSEAGAAAGSVELRSGCIVKRAKSRTRPHAFAVFSIEEPCKPRILLAAQNVQEAQHWMDKIRELLNGEKLLGTETLLKDSYTVTIVPTELSRRCGVNGDCNVTLSPTGLTVTRLDTGDLVIRWQHVTDVLQTRENGDRNRSCALSVDSGFHGGGEMKLSTALAADLTSAVKQAVRERARGVRSRSHPELTSTCDLAGHRLVFSSSWYLDALRTEWNDYYIADPRQMVYDVTGNKTLLAGIVGGEACMWGEMVDDRNVINRVWPRASAVAERLWSYRDNFERYRSKRIPLKVYRRIEEHACRMIRRGIDAQPPSGPGFCIV